MTEKMLTGTYIIIIRNQTKQANNLVKESLLDLSNSYSFTGTLEKATSWCMIIFEMGAISAVNLGEFDNSILNVYFSVFHNNPFF